MIHVFCLLGGHGGWHVHASGFLQALLRTHPVSVHPFEALPPQCALPESIAHAIREAREPELGDVSIGIGPIERMPEVRGARRIAWVVWETTVMPRDKVAILCSMDEVWTPSAWGRDILIRNGVPAASTFVVPEGVDPAAFRPGPPRLSPRPYRFLTVAKWERRKNLEALLTAWSAAFAPADPVELVLHCFNVYQPSLDPAAEVRRLAPRLCAPIVVSPPNAGSMVELYQSADAFVLPTRAEGWGLPVMEAMACGLPPIVTGYSAPAEYVTELCGYQVPVASMDDVHDPVFFPAGAQLGQWAEIDGPALRRTIRHVFEHPEQARERGRQARSTVCSRWTWAHAADAALGRLLSRAA